jgi:methylated-DNA-[protein]-cysteine S-methyltransferase
MATRHAVVDSPLGEITLVADGEAVTGLYFRHHWYKPDESTFGDRVEVTDDSVLADAERQLGEYFRGKRTGFDLRTSLRGDDFQREVWTMLTEIPFGTTTTYGALASRLGDRWHAQEVGDAIGRNPLCVIVPCHRVIGKDGKLHGYAGGRKRKAFLLDLEAARAEQAERLF